jgi:hypothetical protein
LGIKEINDGLDEHRHIKLISYSALRDEQRGKRGKAQRIESLEPRFREGKIFLKRGTTGDLYRQLNAWPDVPNNLDDVIDSLAMQRVVAKPATSKAMIEQFSALEAEEERLSWGGGSPVEKILGRALSQTGRSTQRLRL